MGRPGGGRCLGCKEQDAVIDLARHRTRYCGECFVDHIRTQVRVAIDAYGMLRYDDEILVAVSGGKDSLALWDILLDMGYNASGLYLGLGIGGYSSRSERIVRDYAERRGVRLHVEDLAEEYGFDIPDSVKHPRRSDKKKKNGVGRAACGTCGLSKRYVFNKTALRHGYDVMATGHNLDDEAAQLFGNVLRWQTEFMARQSPMLPASEGGLARKVKPLYRLTEREMAAYCVIKGLDYVVEECPLVEGNTVMRYKDALNELERAAPGTKAHFLFGFLDRVRDEHFDQDEHFGTSLVPCDDCGLPTPAHQPGQTPVCAFCRTRGRLLQLVDRPAPSDAAEDATTGQSNTPPSTPTSELTTEQDVTA
ncbi:MAG: ATP-binding protein [Actinomycetota bacterium]